MKTFMLLAAFFSTMIRAESSISCRTGIDEARLINGKYYSEYTDFVLEIHRTSNPDVYLIEYGLEDLNSTRPSFDVLKKWSARKVVKMNEVFFIANQNTLALVIKPVMTYTNSMGTFNGKGKHNGWHWDCLSVENL